jgi:tetratricopeptide (TPR) repeat protein
MIRLEPTQFRYVAQLASVYIKTGQQALALDQVTKLGLLSDDEPPLLIAQSRLWLALHENDKALSSIAKAHALLPHELDIHLQWISILMLTNHIEQADDELNSLATQHPQELRIAFKQAELAQISGKNDDAFSIYKRILQKDPTYDLALAKLYALVAQNQSSKDFLPIIEPIVESQSQRYFPRSLLAQYHFYYGEKAEAIRHYEFLLHHNLAPNKYALLNRLAILHLPTNLTKSMTLAEEAYQLNAADVGVLSTYGWGLALQGKFERSLSVLRQAYARDSINPQIKYRLAYTLHNLDRNNEALPILKDIAEVNRNFYDLGKVQDLLKKIEVGLSS